MSFTLTYFVFLAYSVSPCYTPAGEEKGKGWEANRMKVTDVRYCARSIF